MRGFPSVKRMPERRGMRFIDLFAGIGGFRRGWNLLGMSASASVSMTVLPRLPIRKLTPKECFRLQGWQSM